MQIKCGILRRIHWRPATFNFQLGVQVLQFR